MNDKFISATAAVALIADADTVGLVGGGGGLLEASCLFAAVERRFFDTGQPRDLTLIHSLGIGDRGTMGLSRFAHEGLVRKVVGGHWIWSPRMQQLARQEKIEAYVLPGGVIAQLYREIGARRPGLFTHVGLGTFVDPRHGGGRMNASAGDDLVEGVTIVCRDILRYKTFPVHVALIRGSFADADGNVSLDREAASLDTYAVAQAAHNCGGKVIVQVRSAVARGSLPARSVHIPGAIVDAVVVDPDQAMTYDFYYDPCISGEHKAPVPKQAPQPHSIRRSIARRAAAELRDGAIINFGYGIPDGVAAVIDERGERDRYYQSLEHGAYGGTLLYGKQFGFVRNPSAFIDAPSQFDFYSGGGLDIAFLGFGELDAAGNVNVSKLAGLTVGPGGFIDIAQNARKVVFCGAFEAKGLDAEPVGGRLSINRHGAIRKLVSSVAQVTFSGPQAVRQGQTIVYVTERAVFELTAEGVVLSEIAPGADLNIDILDRMEFTPIMAVAPKLMSEEIFS